jgi:hypothetical protein
MINWNKAETWNYVNVDKKFTVEIKKWGPWGLGDGSFTWNKYLYLFPGNKHFDKYRPEKGRSFPETPFTFHRGITYYREIFDKDGNLTVQKFGDDYNHYWDLEAPVDSSGTSVFRDAEGLIEEVEEE